MLFRSLIDAAGAMLRAERGDMPPGFVQLLFGRTAPEDLATFEPRELAALAREAWAFLVLRKPGQAKIRFEAPPIESGPSLKAVSILEIVNDDMPFLVDLVMGELNERGIEIHLVRIQSSRSSATRAASSPACRFRSAERAARLARVSFISTSAGSTMRRSVPRSSRRSKAFSPTFVSACRIGRRCSPASAG